LVNKTKVTKKLKQERTLSDSYNINI